MADLRLSVAISDYDHVRDLIGGKVKPKGIAIDHIDLPVEDIFARFTDERCWDVSEMSMARFVSLISQGDQNITGIPVFPSRFFRQHAIYVRTDSPLRYPAELTGKTVGIPEWVQTAIVWVRAWLTHDIGISLADINWIRAGINSPQNWSQVKGIIPDGVSYQEVTDRFLMEMLLAGELDAVICAHPPDLFEARDPRIRRLIEDFQPVEEAYWAKHRIFPMMHTVAIPRTTYDANPWIGPALFAAFSEAKNRSLTRALDGNICRFPIPWAFAWAEKARDMLGDDFWPYGVNANRATLEAFVRSCNEQGVTHRPVSVEELYPENVRDL
ncbi:MAG: 4,5-dihydroxyphthalate decarboxylase [Alphaproteobacteria bacterium]|jgi:4,5-dihydroxyphthalate decarboxylase